MMRVCSTPINPSCAAAAVQGWIGESSGPVNARRGADPGPGVALGDPQHLVQTPVQRAVTQLHRHPLLRGLAEHLVIHRRHFPACHLQRP